MNDKQKKVKTAKCGAKAMPSGGTLMTRHDEDYDLGHMRAGSWVFTPPYSMEETSDFSQSIQPGIVLATGTEAKAKEGQADHPADHAAGGAIVVPDEAPDVTFEEWMQQQIKQSQKEAHEAFMMTEEEKAREAECVRKRREECRRVPEKNQELKQQKEQEEQEEHEADLEWPQWKSVLGRHLIQKAAGTSGTSR